MFIFEKSCLGFIVATAIFTAASAQDRDQRLPKRVEDQYKRIFTFKLEETFRSLSTLNEATRQAQQHLAKPEYSQKSLGFGCASYNDGADIGK